MRYLIAMCLVLAGCVPSAPTVEKPDISGAAQKLPHPGEGLTLVTLDDGTRCIVYSGFNGRSGLSCDWQSTRKVEAP